LPWSGAEAQVIEEVAAGHGEVFMATDFDASVSTVLDRPLDAYRILHFATHGWADSSHPELSSLTFSKFDRHGQSQPSELQLPDIYGLDLDSDLVVLSACDTALGKYIPGEGVLGLTHAFMSAGSRRVLSTLWQVNDQATARLMELFYRALLVDGHPPGRALAIAQRSLMAERRWADPYFWAGVSLQGDWKWGDR
jgi:CHAT domain-containing protein